MHKHIIAVGPLDKSVALCGIKPFHDTFFSHYLYLLNSVCVLAMAKAQQLAREAASENLASSNAIRMTFFAGP
jgi:hypothetical protein